MWISFGLLGFAASAIMFLIGRNSSEISREHLANAANIQLTALIWFVFAWVSMIAFIGFIMLPVVLIVTTLFHCLGLFNSVIDNQEWEPRFCIKAFR